MEWRWVKSFLIIVFIILNCFLGYQVYQRNQFGTVNSESITSIKNILKSRNIECIFNFNDIETKGYMKKISISNNKNIEPEFININKLLDKEDIYIGRNRKILSLPIIITNFLRDTKLTDVVIKDIVLGYYPEMSQIDKNVLSGEAIPAWCIVLEDEREYIYNAYLGEQMNISVNEIEN